jgi:hypothetical protein
MPEPTSSSIGGGAILAAGAVTITGSILGMQYDALLVGLFGGLVSLMFLPAMPPFKVAGTLFTASVFGAIGSPLAPAVAAKYADFLVQAGPTPLRLFAALAIGLFVQFLIGAVIKRLAKEGGAA